MSGNLKDFNIKHKDSPTKNISGYNQPINIIKTASPQKQYLNKIENSKVT